MDVLTQEKPGYSKLFVSGMKVFVQVRSLIFGCGARASLQKLNYHIIIC